MLIRALFWIALLFPQQQPAPAGIQGTVLVAGTNEPIARAQVALTLLRTPGTNPQTPSTIATTNSRGQFELRDVPPGAYRLTIAANGYAKHDYGQKRSTAVAPPFVLAEGQNQSGLVIHLTPAGSMSGVVRSTAGSPLAGVDVLLRRRTYSATGQQSFATVANATSNDRGEYRFYWITPGQYFVQAGGTTPLSFMTAGGAFDDNVRRGNNQVESTYAARFFPGVADAAKGAPVQVRQSDEVRGVDFTVEPQRTFHIRGKLIDGRTGTTPAAGAITVGTSGGGSSAPRYYDPATGKIEILDLLPGTYTINATEQNAASMPFFSSMGPGRAIASQRIVLNSDVDDLILTLALPASINGRIHVEGALPDSTSLDRLRMQLAPADREVPALRFGGNALYSAANADGTFTLNSVPMGEFRVTMTGLPAGLYLKDARLNGADVLNGYSRFSDAGRIELVVSSRAGQLEGIVRDAAGRPAHNAEVVLVPNDVRFRTELFKRVMTGSDGRFVVPSISPGDYKIYAWEDLEPNSYFDPEVLRLYEAQGILVRIQESSRGTVELRMIPASSTP